MPVCSAVANKRIDRVVIIFDLDKVNVWSFFDSKMRKLLKLTTSIS